MKIMFHDPSGSHSVELTPSGKSFRVSVDGETFEANPVRIENGRLDLILNGRHLTAYVSRDGSKRWVTVEGQTYLFTQSNETASSKSRRSRPGPDRTGQLTAPMPGQVHSVAVNEGEAISKGQTILVIEAMKMEIRIQAPQDGTIRRLHVKPGQTVERGQTLVEIEESGPGGVK